MTPDYDILLGDQATLQGYRTRFLIKSSASTIAPRFSTGAQSQSDLDMLKSASIDDFGGGMFQNAWEDKHKASRVVGFYNRYNDSLYPTPEFNTTGQGVITAAHPQLNNTWRITAKVESELYVFVAFSQVSGGNLNNSLFRKAKYTGSADWVEITLPVGVGTGALGISDISPITDLSIHKGFLYVSGQVENATASGTHFTNFRYSLAAGTWQNLGGYGVMMRPLRGVLYHLNINGTIYAMSNELAASAATYTAIDQVGVNDVSNTFIGAEEFNGALWIFKVDGIFRFDGLKATRVLPLKATIVTQYNGALYFGSSNWLYRFDGTNLEKIQYFGQAEVLSSFSVSPDFLFIQTKVVSSASYIDDPKPDPGTPPPANTYQIRHYYYDGVGFYMLDERSITLTTTLTAACFYVGDTFCFVYPDVNDWYHKQTDLTKLGLSTSVATTSQLEVTLSDFDDGFPNVLKAQETLRVLFQDKAASDTIVVKYQLYDGQTWGSWLTASTAATGLIELNAPLDKLYFRIRVNVTVTLSAASSISLKGVALGYTLQPRVRWRWQLGLMTEGNSAIETRNNVKIELDANQLTNIITQSIKQKTPVWLTAPDYARVNLAVNAASLSLRVGGQIPVYTDPYGEPVYIAVKNVNNVWEILKVTAVSYDQPNDRTTLTLAARGYLGVTAANIAVDAEVRPIYKVYVTRLLRDAPELLPNVYNQQPTTNESQLQREPSIEVIEV